ncbi:MAG: glycosyltransferase family 87 protein [Acidobacteriaceae bacterium]
MNSQLRRLKPLLVCLACMLAIFTAWTLTLGIRSGIIGRTDFRSMYSAGYLERTHPTQLYSLDAQLQIQNRLISKGDFSLPYFHPGCEALLFVPFSFLPYPAAYLAFIAFNIVLIALCVLAGMRLFSDPIPYLQPRPGLVVLLFLPVWVAVFQGQDSILFLLLLILAWKQMDDDRPFHAGLLLGLAMFKFQIVLPLACFLALRKGGRLVRGFLLGSTAVVALSFAASPQSPASFVRLVHNAALAGGSLNAPGHQSYISPLRMANFRGLLFAFVGRHLSAHALLALTLAVSVLFLALVAILLRRVGNDRLAFSAALMACLLTSYHLYPHDLTPLLLPIVAIAAAPLPWKRVLPIALCLAPVLLLVFTGADSLFLITIPILLAIGAILFAPQSQLASPDGVLK